MKISMRTREVVEVDAFTILSNIRHRLGLAGYFMEDNNVYEFLDGQEIEAPDYIQEKKEVVNAFEILEEELRDK